MKWLPIWIVFAGLGIGVASHAAPGALRMSWDNCDPQVTHKVHSTATASLIFSVLGNDETHSAYQVRFLLSDDDEMTPDAWRFDGAGCQTEALIRIESFAPPALVKTCPAFKGANALEIKGFTTFPPGDPLPYHETQMRGLLAVTYEPTTAVATTRYSLGWFRFDHLYSVEGAGTPGLTCGGNEVPVTLTIIPPTGYTREPFDGEHPFDMPFPSSVTYGPPLTPVRAATWGQIKNQYR